MDFTPDDSITDDMRRISSKYDVVYWREVSRQNSFPEEYWRAIAKAGLFGILIEKKWGGMEKGLVALALATEETAERYAGLGSYLYASGSLTPAIFKRNASEQVKERLLPSLAKGELRISIALSEETSGIDALSIETTALRSSDHFVINGTKMFVTNVDSADFILLFARTKVVTKNGEKANGISMFLVNAKDTAIRRAKLEKLGMDFNTLYSLEIKDLKVDIGSLIGGLDDAWHSVKEIFEMDRILTSASLVGTGRLALNQAAEYAKNRKVFGKLIGSNQGIQFPLADAIAQLAAAEAIALKAASQADAKRRFADEANIALLESVSAATSATDRAMQAFGGHGYLKEYDVERHWRDVRAYRSHPISEELLLASIAKRSLGFPKSY